MHPQVALIPVTASGDDVADGAVMYAIDRFDVAGLVTALQTCANGEVLFLGFFISLEHLANAHGVSRHRLFREDVLARGDGGSEMKRPEAGGRRQDDVIGAAVDDFLEGVEADEAP